jgi:SAM-dependent methyltransferase
MLEKDLSLIDERLRDKFGSVRVLDCGGGSGNLTLKMLRRGWVATIVDVSSEMLDLLKAKANANRYQAEFVHSSIESFCASSDKKFEVVTFSSVLHHLYDPLSVVGAVAAKVAPGGFFYSNFDPAIPKSPVLATCFRNLDTVAAKILRDRKDVLPGLLRRFRKAVRGKDAVLGRRVASPGDIAEYHAHKGVDDNAIISLLESRGFRVDRMRYGTGRTELTRRLNESLRLFPSFRLLAQLRESGQS